MRKNYLRALLSKKGIKTVDLAKRMGIKPATLNKKIKGDVKFSEKDIKVLLEVLEMTYEQIFDSNVSVVTINDKCFVVSLETANEINRLIELDREVS